MKQSQKAGQRIGLTSAYSVRSLEIRCPQHRSLRRAGGVTIISVVTQEYDRTSQRMWLLCWNTWTENTRSSLSDLAYPEVLSPQ